MSRVSGFFLALLIACSDDFKVDHPIVFTGELISLNNVEATLSARIASRGNQPLTESGFVWGLYPGDNDGIRLINPDVSANEYVLKTSTPFIQEETYYVRAYAQSQHAITYGREVAFRVGGTKDLGSWTTITTSINQGTACELTISFNVGALSYFLLSNGAVYAYNPTNNNLQIRGTNPQLANAMFGASYLGQAYVFIKNSFYLFNPVDLSLSQLSPIPNQAELTGSTMFLLDDYLYVGLGYNFTSGQATHEFWKYKIPSDSWQRIADFPGNGKEFAFGFSLAGNGFVGGGSDSKGDFFETAKDLWQYDPKTDQWKRKMDVPVKPVYFDSAVAFNGMGYCFSGGDLLEYNADFNSWRKMTHFGDKGYLCYPNLLAINQHVYLISSTDNFGNGSLNIWSYAK